MAIYVAEVNGRGLAAFDAADETAADAFVDDEAFRANLIVLEHDGAPLWDGTTDVLVREAFPEELDVWETCRARASLPDTGGDRDGHVVYLVEVVDPAGRRLPGRTAIA